MMEWAANKLCQNKEKYFGDGTLQKNQQFQNELIVLDTFENVYKEQGVDIISHGLIMSSRLVFKNVLAAHAGQEDELVISTDGTYKIHFGM